MAEGNIRKIFNEDITFDLDNTNIQRHVENR
jgi:hypothetical protein